MACLPDVKLIVYILVILFGMGSWVAVNGLWVELPILVDQAPEKWNLPSYITVIIQIANVGPILYTIVNKISPSKFNEKHGVFLLVVLGATGSLLLVFFWKDTSYIGGVKHSTGLIFSVFLLSLVDCTSSVVFLPYMSIFKPQYISALYIGEGLSGLVPSLVALGQGVGKTVCVNKTINQTTNETAIFPEYLEPNFPVEDFFYFLFSIMIICGLSFSLLHYLPYCKREHVNPNVDISGEVRFTNADSASYRYTEFSRTLDVPDVHCSISSRKTCSNTFTGKMIWYLILIGCINAIGNGILPSVSSYANIPYGNDAYHLSATLSNIASPLTCLILLFLPVMSPGIIAGSAVVCFSLSTYILVIASQSPSPPMMQGTIGAFLIVSKSFCAKCVNSNSF